MRVSRLVVLVVLFSVAAFTEMPLTFTYTTIKVAGAQSTAIYGINNAGAMVGSYVDGSGAAERAETIWPIRGRAWSQVIAPCCWSCPAKVIPCSSSIVRKSTSP
jgi:hypothetical protein